MPMICYREREMWKVKTTVVLAVIEATGGITPKLAPTVSEISVQKSAILGTAMILCRTLRLWAFPI